MAEFTGPLVKYPSRVSFIGYAGMIVVGALLLTQPFSRTAGASRIGLLDALFTSTSASCVTGLAVRSTEHEFSFTGQLIILALIQLGGIGIMTVTTFVMFHLGSRENLRHRAIITETFGTDSRANLRWILSRVLLLTFFFEGCGFVLLLLRNLIEMPFGTACWHALFHSISAFCNAGFALRDSSMCDYRGDLLVNVTISGLVIVGGLGFPVLFDIGQHRKGLGIAWVRLHLHTKLMLIGTACLLVIGTISVLALEWDGVLEELPLKDRLLASFFHSMSCRTAGFNSVSIGDMTNATLFISLLLMLIGAGPGSTGGGFKVTTLTVLVLRAAATFNGRTRLHLFRRTIPRECVDRAVTTAVLFSVLAIVALCSVLVVEQSDVGHNQAEGLFMEAAFEVVSALGTVGLTAGLTAKLSAVGKLVIIVLMFLGRLGPITVFVALSRSARKEVLEFPSEEPIIG